MSGGAPRNFFRTTPSQIGLVLFIKIYMEKEELMPQAGFTEFCILRPGLYDLTLESFHPEGHILLNISS